jgi:hypothetical protein
MDMDMDMDMDMGMGMVVGRRRAKFLYRIAPISE